MRKILMKDVTGKVVKVFDSATEAGNELCISPSSVLAGIKKKVWRNGFVLEFAEELPKKEEGKREENDVKQRAPRKERPKANDEMTAEELEQAVKEGKDMGLEYERMVYEVRMKVVYATPCMKRDTRIEKTMVGSLRCTKCRYFRGKCKELRTVLCCHKSQMMKGWKR